MTWICISNPPSTRVREKRMDAKEGGEEDAGKRKKKKKRRKKRKRRKRPHFFFLLTEKDFLCGVVGMNESGGEEEEEEEEKKIAKRRRRKRRRVKRTTSPNANRNEEGEERSFAIAVSRPTPFLPPLRLVVVRVRWEPLQGDLVPPRLYSPLLPRSAPPPLWIPRRHFLPSH